MLAPVKIEKYRQRLLTLMRRIKGDLDMLRDETLRGTGGEAGGGLSNAPLHQGDLSSREYEEEVNLNLVGNEERILAEADTALSRIEQGTFGGCEQCLCAIGEERLEALPYARFCVRCAREKDKPAG